MNHLLGLVKTLHTYEEVILFNNVLSISAEDERETAIYLQEVYEKESLEYPFSPPSFSEDGALWGAKVIYLSAQFLLFRTISSQEALNKFPADTISLTASAILSADLCLRFLPAILNQTKLIDMEDPLATLYENILQKWNYSSVTYELDYSKIDFNVILENECLTQLYVDRIILYKNKKLAHVPKFKERVQSSLGMYESEFWDDLSLKGVETHN